MTSVGSSRIAGLVETLRRNVRVTQKNLAGVTQEASLLSVAQGGSTLNWVIGHIVATRDNMLQALDTETTWDSERGRKYRSGSSVPLGHEVDETSELLLELGRSQALLEAALGGATEALLAEPSGQDELSKLEWLEFLAWHDTYHVGQTAVYRRLAGLTGTLG